MPRSVHSRAGQALKKTGRKRTWALASARGVFLSFFPGRAAMGSAGRCPQGWEMREDPASLRAAGCAGGCGGSTAPKRALGGLHGACGHQAVPHPPHCTSLCHPQASGPATDTDSNGDTTAWTVNPWGPGHLGQPRSTGEGLGPKRAPDSHPKQGQDSHLLRVPSR